MAAACIIWAFFFICPDPSAAVVAADEAFLRIDYPAAVPAYGTLLQEKPEDLELLWRTACVFVCTGEVAIGDERMQFLRKAEFYARKCIRADETKADGHTRLATAFGYIALEADLADQLSRSNKMLAEVDRALVLNPSMMWPIQSKGLL